MFTNYFPLLFLIQHRGIWARELTDAVCVDINHRYRLLAFGCAR